MITTSSFKNLKIHIFLTSDNLSNGKLLKYLIRWQLSTPILALALYYLSSYGTIASTIIANLIGGLIFYKVDKRIIEGD